jgi:hypothetical protein
MTDVSESGHRIVKIIIKAPKKRTVSPKLVALNSFPRIFRIMVPEVAISLKIIWVPLISR